MATERRLQENDEKLNRRELLKILAAGGTALAASAIIPDRWSKPVVGSGVLPAHAQSTCTNTLVIIRVGQCGECPGGNVAYVQYTPESDTPLSASVHYGGLGVPSVLTPDNPGYFYLYFSLPGVPTPTTILEIEVTFSSGCTGYAQTDYEPIIDQ
jgi:hypothetical protein